LSVRLIRNRKKDLNGLIDAVRFLCHVISEAFIGPGPTASTDLSKFTLSAFSLIAIGISKILEDLRDGPNLLERFFFYISTIHFEITAGLNLTDMRDEAEGDTSQTSPSRGIQSFLLVKNLFPLFFGPLSENAVVVRGTGSLELEGDVISLLIKPVEGFFIIQGRDPLIFKLLSPSCGNQEEDVMGCCTESDSEMEDLSDQMEVGLRDGRIDLEFESPFFCHLDPSKRTLKGTARLSEGIVCLRIWAVEADADPLNP
jgi:hypothetical protein